MDAVRRAGALVLLAAAYFAAGRFGLSLAFVNASTSAIWPPSGLAIAAILLWGPRVWPAIFAGALLVNVTTSGEPLASVLIACGNTSEALIAGWLVRRHAGGREVFDRSWSIFVYVGAAAAACAIAATVGMGTLVLRGLAGDAHPAMTWLTWWTGDVSSALLVAPTVLTWTRGDFTRLTAFRFVEAVMLFGVVFGTSYVAFGPTPAGTRFYPLFFAILPGILWAAVRFGQRAVAASMLVVTVTATIGTLNGFGPVARFSPTESLLLLQAYLCVKMIATLALAAEVAARRAVERQMQELNADLANRVEARSRELERLHGRLVEAQGVAHIGSWEWDVVQNRIWWSDEMYRLYGLPIGSPVRYERYVELIHPDDRAAAQKIVNESGRTGAPFTFDHRLVTPDGIERVLHAEGHVVLDDDGNLLRMFGIGHDITDRKRAEEERLQLAREQAARLEAEEASRMKDFFLATLSHELRTPLNSIVGWAQLLKEQAPDDQLRERAIDAIQRNVAIQAQLVSDILDVVRLNAGAITITSEPLMLASVIEGALEIVRPVIDAKRITLTVEVPDGAEIRGDGKRLQQVFWNLLANAAKFVPEGGTVAVRAAVERGSVRIQIEDNGPGIAANFLPHVFEQFTQADSSLTREHGGLGLGLSIARNLVQLHGGTIVAANRPEGGALFTVSLPAAMPESAEAL